MVYFLKQYADILQIITKTFKEVHTHFMGESLLVLKLMELNGNFRFIGIKIFWNSYFHFSLYIHYIYTHLYRYFFNYSTFNPTSIKSMHKVYAILNAEVAYKKIFRGVLLS